MQNHAPEVRSPYNLNRFKSKAAYSSAAGRWYIANINGEPIGRGTVFNIVIISGETVGEITKPNPNPTNPITPVGNTGSNPRLPLAITF